MQEYEPMNISVTGPINDAIERTKFMLFSPFDISKWFIIGFCAFLATLSKGGVPAFNGTDNFDSYDGVNSQSLQEFKNFVLEHLEIIITLSAVVIILIIAFTALICWLSSRGRFMFLHCVAKNVAEIKIPWATYRNEANSLFLFRISVGFIMFFAVILIAGGIFLSVLLTMGGEQVVLGIALIVFLVLALICFSIMGGLVIKFTEDFILPIMYLQKCRCVEAWKRFWPLLTCNKGKFTLYILFQIVIGMAVGTIILLLIIITCCIAGCFLAIPYIGAVLTLPITVFLRSYSLYYIRQYSPQLNVFEEFQEVLYD